MYSKIEKELSLSSSIVQNSILSLWSTKSIGGFLPRYKSAARQFLEASLDHCECPDLMSPNNVAIYGGLTALATFDRTELLKQVGEQNQA